MNARFFSEDIPHNLGIGDVSISVSVEYEDSGERRLLFGDGEIFATKTEKAVPRIQACSARKRGRSVSVFAFRTMWRGTASAYAGLHTNPPGILRSSDITTISSYG